MDDLNFTNVLTNLLKGFMGVAVAVLVPFIIQFIQQKTQQEKYKKFKFLADIIVRFAEGKIPAKGTGQVKNAMAVETLIDRANKEISPQEAELFIEASHQSMVNSQEIKTP